MKFTRAAIFKGVACRMEWEGIRNPTDENACDIGSITEADRSLFHSLFDEAAMHAIDICRHFLTSASNTDDALTLCLDLSRDAKADDLPMAMENMMTNHILTLWQEMVNPDRADTSAKKREASTSKILSILYHHSAPKRK